ncbi:MAG: hypothetical protein Q9207_007102 [Kuettlingeria erythrocarpa]
MHAQDHGVSHDKCGSAESYQVTIARYRGRPSYEGSTEGIKFSLCSESDFRSRRWNAGLVFSGMDSFLDPPEDGSDASLAVKNIKLIEQLDILLHISMRQSQMLLLLRHPSISDKYAKSIKNTFESVLVSWTQSKHLSTDMIAVPSPQDLDQMLAWNPTDPFSQKKAACLHHLFEDMVQRMPEAEAICSWDGNLTYQTLDALSSIAGERLRGHGVKPGVYVPFAYDKSLWTIVACLGILKAGGAFVPISVHEPASRLLAILKSIDARVLVTGRQFEEKFRALVVNVVVIDAATIDAGRRGTNGVEEHSGTGLGGKNCQQEVQPTDPVFVLFTSGSTGEPKGMIHDHASICTQWLLQGEALGYRGARVLQFAAHTFDVFIIDVFTALLYGGCVCIPSEEDRQNNIIGVINKMKADYATLTPSFAGLIEPSEVPTLKTLSIGGEALPQDRVKRWAEKVRFIQIYGPAEVGICLAVAMKPKTRPETVGYPLPHCSCWLVDAEDSECLVPIGAVGELLVAGPSLATGYLNNPAKTQACFIAAPSWARAMGLPFKQFYKTGDLLRLNTDAFDGSYDFVGRKDSQIKLRGQRIEPGEVEYHIGTLPGVAHAMVTKPESGSYAGQLVAIVQTKIDQGYFHKHSHTHISVSTHPILSFSMVRESLSKLMPSYMIPGVLLEVDALPCVPSMKIDRRSVQAWLNGLTGEPVFAIVERFPIIAEDSTARCLGQAVADLLERKESNGCSQTTPRDFILQDTGIDSIQIISLAMFIRKKFGVKVPSRKLLDPATTIRGLAQLMDGHSGQMPDGQFIHSNGTNSKTFDLVHEFESLSEQLKPSLHQAPTVPMDSIPHDHQPSRMRNIFLTGSTGFLGTAILHNLLEHHPTTRIYALIRCPTEQEGLLRLLQTLESHNRWRPAYLSRLFVIPGDLNHANLGMSAQHISLLLPPQPHDSPISPSPSTPPQATTTTTTPPNTTAIDTIIHAAAKVHYSTSYAALKPANTTSVLFLLNAFFAAPSMRRFIYLSGGEHPHTSSSVTDPRYVRSIEDDANGYTQSKVVGELLVRFAAVAAESVGGNHSYGEDEGEGTKSVRVVKPGYMIGDAETGMANRSDFLWRFIAGCIDIGQYDAGAEGKWVFVDDVADVAARVTGAAAPPTTATITTSTAVPTSLHNEESDTTIDRILHGLPFHHIWAMLTSDFGYHLEPTATDIWMQRLLAHVEAEGERHLLFPLLDTLEREGRGVGVVWRRKEQRDVENDGDGSDVGDRDDDAGDNGDGNRENDIGGGSCERVKTALKKNVEYLIAVGFLPAPPGRRRTPVV